MTESPRHASEPSRTTKGQSPDAPSPLSAPLLIFMTALDTTWRAFVPTLGGVFAGIGLDYLFHSAPIATIICLIAGVIISALLVAQQLRAVRRMQK